MPEQLTTPTTRHSLRSVHWLVAFGKMRMMVKVGLLVGAAALAGSSIGCRGTDQITLASPRTFTASATDSLRAPIYDGYSAVLAPGSTLAVGKESVNPMGARGWQSRLSGAVRLTIPSNAVVEVHAPPGHANLTQGTYVLTASPTTFSVRTISGDDALLYKPAGFFSVVPRKVPADDVGVAETSRWALRVSKQ